MAVPANCSQYVSAKVNTLNFMTIISTCMNRLDGKAVGNLSMCVEIKSLMQAIPRRVSILVYMAVASAVNINASSGIVRAFSSAIIVVEFLTNDLTNGRSSFILKSSHVEKIARKLLELLTTGLKVTGVLCTLGSP